ncbi:uncharacterized protein FRV6_13055 [Fusarium oxysporum]|uniref:Uncharacterized protein n=1 Tax=Fusarium oxysporum TaxID=5507 RepID=A0A2H3TK38_FUSOX|nr:uncharacterized protein FRV6_13055 [Fusarium oxysporum]
MSSRYWPLLPNPTPASSSTEDASGSQSQSSLSGLTKIQRAGTRTACESCRKKKTRENCITSTRPERQAIATVGPTTADLITPYSGGSQSIPFPSLQSKHHRRLYPSQNGEHRVKVRQAIDYR